MAVEDIVGEDHLVDEVAAGRLSEAMAVGAREVSEPPTSDVDAGAAKGVSGETCETALPPLALTGTGEFLVGALAMANPRRLAIRSQVGKGVKIWTVASGGYRGCCRNGLGRVRASSSYRSEAQDTDRCSAYRWLGCRLS